MEFEKANDKVVYVKDVVSAFIASYLVIYLLTETKFQKPLSPIDWRTMQINGVITKCLPEIFNYIYQNRYWKKIFSLKDQMITQHFCIALDECNILFEMKKDLFKNLKNQTRSLFSPGKI